MAKRDIVVIGGSAGAVTAVAEILRNLPPDFPATVFVALHLAPTSEEWLAAVLTRTSSLPVESPSGELDDGRSGLQAVKACGGMSVVQNPEDALHPAMLQTALANVVVDHSPRLRDIPPLLMRLVRESPGLVGHAFHIKSLANDTDDQIDRTLWAAIRMFEQPGNIARMLAEQERSRGRAKRAELYDARAEESQRHAQRLRELNLNGAVVLDERSAPQHA